MDFQVGQRVKHLAYTDCFGEFHPETRNLVVESIRHMPESSIPAYDRINAVADRPQRVIQCEAAARFFALDEVA